MDCEKKQRRDESSRVKRDGTKQDDNRDEIQYISNTNLHKTTAMGSIQEAKREAEPYNLGLHGLNQAKVASRWILGRHGGSFFHTVKSGLLAGGEGSANQPTLLHSTLHAPCGFAR